MKLGQLSLVAGFVGVALAVPVAAQTMQLTPTVPSDSSIMRPQGESAARAAGQFNQADINTASPAILGRLPGISMAEAAAIIRNRPYRQPNYLVGRHILRPAVYDAIRGNITTKRG